MRSLKANQMLSVVAPVFNESEGVGLFVEQLLSVLHGMLLPCRYEIVFVDDGSTDGTSQQLEMLAARYSDTLRVVRFARNFGFCAAASAALRYAQGDVVILMDADMQDDPDTFARFLEKWREGYDVVYAVRTSRRDSRLIRGLTWSFYRALGVMAQIPLPLDAGTFALMDRRAVDALSALPERNRYIPGLRCWVGFRQIGIPVERQIRRHGKSRMGLRKLWDLALMSLFSFSFMPVFIIRLASLAALGVAVTVMPASLLLCLLGGLPWHWTALFFLVAFFGGTNLLCMSMLGEYVALIYDEVRQRPLYVIDAVFGKTGSTESSEPPAGNTP